MTKRVLTYQYTADLGLKGYPNVGSIEFDVEGETGWTDEQFFELAETTLFSLVKTPKKYWVSGVSDKTLLQ